MSDILKNCIITHEDSEILKYYGVHNNNESYHTGIDVKATNIYCPCKGVCIFTGLIDNKLSCTVQYSNNICLRFTHLKNVNVTPGQLVEYDQLIGVADKYVHFEYLTSENSYPHFRVFFNAQTSYFMYKHDPMLVLSGNTGFDNSSIINGNTNISEEEFDSRYELYIKNSKLYPELFYGFDNNSIYNSDLLGE